MSGCPFLNLQETTKEQRTELDVAISKVLDHSHYLFGPEVTAFENDFAAWVGTKACVGAANGTAAIEMALFGAGVKPGDKVVTQANTFAATGLSILHVGATPVFVDCDDHGYMNMDEAAKACADPAVKALIVVHLYGACPDMDRVVALAEETGTLLIEDCAQAHGTAWKGQKVGTFGVAGCFSFYPGKNMGAMGDAGAVVTNDLALADAARTYGTLGAPTKYNHTCPGINSRMDTLQAAILSVKLKNLDGWNAKRRQVAGWYEKHFEGCKELTMLQAPSLGDPHMTHTYHLGVFRLTDPSKREALMAHLRSKEIGCLIHYPYPCHTMGAFVAHNDESHPTSEALSISIISLPMHPYVSEDQVVQIRKEVDVFFGN